MLGLTLEGGGAKGAFHMGAVKALLEEGYKFNGVSGTSIGALNGAIIAQGDFQLGYEWWENLNTSSLFDIEQSQIEKFLNKKIDKEVLAYLSSKIKSVIEGKGLDTSKIRETLDNIINEDKLRNSGIDFGIVTVSISDKKPLELYKEDIPYGKMVNYLMASASHPVLKTEPIDGKRYLDGAFYDNCPINLLVKKGYKEVIAVRTLALGRVRKIKDKSVKVTNIIPSEGLGGTLKFDNNLIRRNMKMGYCDAMRVIKGLKGKKYYIRPVDNNELFSCLLLFPDEAICEIGRCMGLPLMEPKRVLFEKIFPGLSRMLKLPIASTYQDIIIGVLEHMAHERGIERYKIRDFKSFYEEIKSKPVDKSVIQSPRKKLPIVFAKDLILNKMGEELLEVLKV